jgi:UDP-N-acetylmuramate--alanine ligase
MHIYFSGIGGVGIGPLAQIALDAGYEVSGSDLKSSPQTEALTARGANVFIGQDGSQIREVHESHPIDAFVYTAALPTDHPELAFAKAHGIHTAKRDELLASLIKDKGLKLIAVAGTHGKTTTTGMLVWAFQQLYIPASYSVGSTLSFGPSGAYNPESEYFIYECDEFDRNMLHFSPHVSVITSLDYDHPDTYKTEDDYRHAFVQFLEQSDYTFMWEKDLRFLKADPQADLEAYDDFTDVTSIKLPGKHIRQNGYLAERAMIRLFPDLSPDDIRQALNGFPGTGRRMEQLAPNLYSDYAHHPTEIAAMMELARELNEHVVVVYQPHQNVRQHEVKDHYTDVLKGADTIYWLPTYLSREDPALEVLTPAQLTEHLVNRDVVHEAELDDKLWHSIETARRSGKLVLCMGAGDIDSWLRSHIDKST